MQTRHVTILCIDTQDVASRGIVRLVTAHDDICDTQWSTTTAAIAEDEFLIILRLRIRREFLRNFALLSAVAEKGGSDSLWIVSAGTT